MSSDFVRNLLVEQRGRLIGSILGHVEREVYPKLDPEARSLLRQKVLTSVGVYHDTVLDILKASVNDGAVVNEEALRLLADLHRDVQALRRG